MNLLIINDNPYGENVYIYYDEFSGDGVIIDPGDSFKTIGKTIEQNKINVKGILLTHGHFDHVFSVNEVRKLTNAPVYAHESEAELLQNAEYNRSSFRGLEISVVPDKFFSNGDIFKVSDEAELKVLHTPGHTAGGVCYYDKKNAMIFTGDTLFKETIGRTDMPTGNYAALLQSIREKLFTLPDNVTVYPGHEQNSTIKHEKKFNSCV